MPVSKKRKKMVPIAPPPPATLQTATLALTEASLEIVREAELHIQKGEDLVEVHHYLRTAALGLMIAYSQLAGLPDPRDGAPK